MWFLFLSGIEMTRITNQGAVGVAPEGREGTVGGVPEEAEAGVERKTGPPLPKRGRPARRPVAVKLAFTPAEAGDALGVSKWTVYAWIRGGRLRAFHAPPAVSGDGKLGRIITLISRAELDRFVAEMEAAGAR